MQITNYFTYKDEVSRAISWGHYFLFLNIFLALLIGLGYIYDTPRPTTGLAFFYLIISWLGHFSSIVFIFYLIIFFPLSFIGSLKYYRYISVVLSVCIFLILLIDVKLYQSIKIHLNFSVLDLFFEQEGFSTGLNFNFLYIATPILLGIELLFSSLSWKHIYIHNHQKLTYAFSALFLLSFLSTHTLHIWANAYKYVPITIQKSLFPAYYPMTANTFLTEHGWIQSYSNSPIERPSAHNISKLNYPLENIKVKPIEKPYNVLLVLVNGLNSASISEELTPNLFKFSQENDNYVNHYLGSTDPNINLFELNYGLPGQYLNLINQDKTPSVLVNELLQQDYKISSYITAKSSTKAQEYAKSNGIRVNKIKAFSSDEKVINYAIRNFNNWNSRPHMTVLSLNSPQTLEQDSPNDLTYLPQLSNEDLENHEFKNTNKVNNRYFNCLNILDKNIGKLINSLEDTGLLSNTVVIFTSISGNKIQDSSSNYNRETNHVPLIISWPGSITNSTISALSSTQDIAPTLAEEILGVTNDVSTYSTGLNLREITNRDWVLSGDMNEIHIIDLNQTTIFDKHGNAVIYGNDQYSGNSHPNIKTLIQAMKYLNKFKEK